LAQTPRLYQGDGGDGGQLCPQPAAPSRNREQQQEQEAGRGLARHP